MNLLKYLSMLGCILICCAGCNKAGCSKSDDDLVSVLYTGCDIGNVGMVKSVLQSHPKLVNARDSSGSSPLHYAAENGYSDIVKLLLDHHADVDAKANGGETPLHCAVRSRHIDVVRILLAYGADVNSVDEIGQTPILDAIVAKDVKIAKVLIDNHANVNACTDYISGDSPLHFAKADGEKEMVRLLLKHGAK